MLDTFRGARSSSRTAEFPVVTEDVRTPAGIMAQHSLVAALACGLAAAAFAQEPFDPAAPDPNGPVPTADDTLVPLHRAPADPELDAVAIASMEPEAGEPWWASGPGSSPPYSRIGSSR